MSDDARRIVTPAPVGESGVRDLRGQLLEQRRQLEAVQKKNAALGDELEEVTVRLLRAEAELATAKEREAESARQWLAMSADLAAARARVAKQARLLERTNAMLRALHEHAKGTSVESQIDAIVGVLELHRPDPED